MKQLKHFLAMPIVALALVATAGHTSAARPAVAATTVRAQSRVVVGAVEFDAFAGNLLGDPTKRSVTVYLPPSYDAEKERRFPVVYLLHGVGDTDARWRSNNAPWQSIRSIMDQGIADGSVGEMIVVMPECRSSFMGGMYSDSPVHGDQEQYIVSELVAHVDATYRTLADREHRGIAGHSMGGYAAIKFGMIHPDVFSVVYGMNAACLGWAADLSIENMAFATAARIVNLQQLQQSNFYNMAVLMVGQSWSPNPDKPPFYADLPFVMSPDEAELVRNEPVHRLWEANMPLYMVENVSVQGNLRTLKGLRFDSAFVDEFGHIPPTSRALSERMTQLAVPHTFEMYNGDHRNRLNGQGGRLHTVVFPYFSRLLGAE